jgi:hypothetical protein
MEEYRSRVFQNRVLRGIGPKREEVAGGWRRLPNLYAAPPNFTSVIKLRSMEWAGHPALMEEMRNTYRIMVGKPEGGTLLGRPRHKREDNIGMDL